MVAIKTNFQIGFATLFGLKWPLWASTQIGSPNLMDQYKDQFYENQFLGNW